MKILYFSPHPTLNLSSPTGYGTHMREMVRAFRKLGHEVELCIMGGEVPIAVTGQNSSIPKRCMKKIIPSLLWETVKDINLLKYDRYAKKQLDAQVRSFGPDLIYERGYYMMTSGVQVANERGTSHILEVNAPFPEERVQMSGGSLMLAHAKQIEKKQFQMTSKLVVVSTALRDYIDHIVPGSSKKICVTPNAISPEGIRIDTEQQTLLRQTFGISDSDMVFGFVGSMFPHHGVDLMIQAFEKVYSRIPNARLLIVGDGEIRLELEKLATSLSCGDRICFTGNVPHEIVYDHISIMDITIMGRSNWYGSPVKIFEYGALGKPVIAPDCSPVRDVMTADKHGLLVRPLVDDIADAMAKLAKDAELRQEIGDEFQGKVFSEHAWEKMAEKVLVECRTCE